MTRQSPNDALDATSTTQSGTPRGETVTGTHVLQVTREQTATWQDLGGDVWSYLTRRGAAINYNFIDMAVGVPRDTGVDSPCATWKLNGTLRITTDDKHS